jgi:VIT1/CCC1 family predicted Fe2+/Mn2+ transporter
MGVAAAGANLPAVQITGFAGLLAGALSMAAGEYVSVRSQREFYEYQMALEREELAEYPDAEAEELALIYNARGIDMEEARRMSAALLSHPQQALDVLRAKSSVSIPTIWARRMARRVPRFWHSRSERRFQCSRSSSA